MRKLNKKQKLIILTAIVIILVIISLIIGANIIKTNIINSSYNSANNNSSSSNLLPEYIKEGITLGGVTGTLVDLDTSDATATPEDILWGETAYVNGKKITGTMPIKQVKDLVAGEKIKYDTGNPEVGDNGVVDCIVLYDKAYDAEHGTNYGIQIISTDIIKNSEGTKVAVNLGSNDETVDGSGFNKARNSYNNALKRLYDEAQKYLNTTYASEARCVGSDPADPDWDTETDEAEYFTRNEGDEDYYSYMKNYYGTFKDIDDKYDKDWTQMGTIEGIKPVSDYYWLASRSVDSRSTSSNFRVRYVTPSGATGGYYLCYVHSPSGTNTGSDTRGFRPVFTLKSDIKITEGDGVDTPYRLES